MLLVTGQYGLVAAATGVLPAAMGGNLTASGGVAR